MALELAVFFATDLSTPTWLWRAGLALPILGLALDIVTRRVAVVLLFRTLAAVAVGAVGAMSAWVAAAMWRSQPIQILAALAILGGHLLIASWAYWRGHRMYQERPDVEDLIDPIDATTGLFDPGKWMSRAKERRRKNAGEAEAARAAGSVAKSLILLIPLLLGTPGYEAVIALLGGALGLLMSYLAATSFAQFVVISSWEHSHRTGVYLMKRSL